MLAAGGEDALQMKDLSQRAGRLAGDAVPVLPGQGSRAAGHPAEPVLLGSGPGDRGGAVRRDRARPGHQPPAREFRAEQREPRLTAALSRVISETRRSYSEIIEQVEHLHLQMLEHVAGGGAPISAEQRQLLPVVQAIFGAATRRWLAGCLLASPGQVRDPGRL